jgi:predicted nucleic acid-binding protein
MCKGPHDEVCHAAAAAAWRELVTGHEVLVSSSYVSVETVALLQRRLGLEAVEDLHTDIAPLMHVLWVGAEVHQEAITMLLGARHRYLSLVDCVSFVLMRQHQCRAAFAFDRLFVEQGLTVVPETRPRCRRPGEPLAVSSQAGAMLPALSDRFLPPRCRCNQPHSCRVASVSLV